jgi:integrase
MKISGLYKMQGSKYFWYRWTGLDGKRHAVSLKTVVLAEALKAIEKIRVGEWVRTANAAPVGSPLTKLVEVYLAMAKKRRKKPMRPGTAKRQEAILLKFLKDTGAEGITDISRGDINAWLDRLEKDSKSPDTVHTYARSLHTFVMWLVEEKKLLSSDIDFDIPGRGAIGRKNWIKHDEVLRVIEAAKEIKNQDLTFILYCGFHAGLRRNEIVNLRAGWFDGKYVHVQNDPKSGFVLKDKENRSIQLTDDFKAFLIEYLKGRAPGEYALRPAKAQGKNDYRYDFSRTWKTHMERCGVTCTIHDARRSFASNLISEGESIYIVAKWLGDGVQVVERSYGHLAPSAGNINRLTGRVT